MRQGSGWVTREGGTNGWVTLPMAGRSERRDAAQPHGKRTRQDLPGPHFQEGTLWMKCSPKWRRAPHSSNKHRLRTCRCQHSPCPQAADRPRQGHMCTVSLTKTPLPRWRQQCVPRHQGPAGVSAVSWATAVNLEVDLLPGAFGALNSLC